MGVFPNGIDTFFDDKKCDGLPTWLLPSAQPRLKMDDMAARSCDMLGWPKHMKTPINF